MNNTQQTNGTLSTRLLNSLGLTQDAGRWEQLMISLLRRLELNDAEKKDAENEYMALADDIARKLDIPRHDVSVYPQGSMRTQTTISPRGNAKFDIDVMVELTGPNYRHPDSERMFQAFGKALEGREDITGSPVERRRCWKLNYPNKPYYFDVTPAVADASKAYGAALRVRDPDTVWSPSNPKEYADWFTKIAENRFAFQLKPTMNGLIEARKSVDPLPSEPVGVDDILRRTVQLIKLHRDNYYHYAPDAQKDAKPISVIIVTAATHAFENIWNTRRNSMRTPIEVVLAIVEDMSQYIKRASTGKYWVANPMLSIENFADRWNTDKGVRAREFSSWHKKLEVDLEALLADKYSASTESKLRSVFGQAGVDAWKDSLGLAGGGNSLLKGLLASSGAQATNPTQATPIGRKTTTLA